MVCWICNSKHSRDNVGLRYIEEKANDFDTTVSRILEAVPYFIWVLFLLQLRWLCGLVTVTAGLIIKLRLGKW